MPSSRKSSAKKRMSYSPEEKKRIIATARVLFSNNETNYTAAKKLGVSPSTLKKWMKERREGMEKVRMTVEVNAKEAIKQAADEIRRSLPESKPSWEEVRDLCEEHDALSQKLGKLKRPHPVVTSRGPLDWKIEYVDYDSKAQAVAGVAIERRIQEIEQKVGMDAIHEYRDRKATRCLIEEAEERCSRKIESVRTGVLVSAGIAGASILLHFLV